MSSRVAKTNAMRQLERGKVAYEVVAYDCHEFIDGREAAEHSGIPLERSYKTLVAEGKTGNHYCFCVSCQTGLDLKKCARSVGERSVSLVHHKDITALTGYIRGGCSPLGLKKPFKTVIDECAKELDWIAISGGKVGLSLKVNPVQLAQVINATFQPLFRENPEAEDLEFHGQ